jgi:hypothetical protein
LQTIFYDQFILEYQFPMHPDGQWCPDRSTGSTSGGMDATPAPCQFAGKRIIQSEGPQQTQAGAFEKCYQMGDVYNSGRLMQTFCDGIGVVERRYDHSGTRFGFSQVLTAFNR